MRIWCEIIKVNLRHHFPAPFLSAVCIMTLTILLFPVAALRGEDVSKPLEYLMPFLGAALLTPVFLPEQDCGIGDVVKSKKISGAAVYMVRLLYSVTALTAFIVLFTGLMYLNECEVRWVHLYGGVYSALFMGSIGFMVSGVSGNTIAGYMAVFIYYLACFGLKKQLGVFWLFRMSKGLRPEKIWLLFGSILLVGLTFAVLGWRRRR